MNDDDGVWKKEKKKRRRGAAPAVGLMQLILMTPPSWLLCFQCSYTVPSVLSNHVETLLATCKLNWRLTVVEFLAGMCTIIVGLSGSILSLFFQTYPKQYIVHITASSTPTIIRDLHSETASQPTQSDHGLHWQ